MLERLIQIDTNIFFAINQWNSPFFDGVMELISERFVWIPAYAFLVYLIIKKFGWKSIYVIIGIALLITLSDQLSASFFKPFFHRLRPCRNPDLQPFVHLVNNHCGGKYGFVSSHAANAFALATYISLLFKHRYWTLGMFFWATPVAYSRIYLGVHYPGDVLSGALLGVILGWLLFYILRKTKRIDIEKD